MNGEGSDKLVSEASPGLGQGHVVRDGVIMSPFSPSDGATADAKKVGVSPRRDMLLMPKTSNLDMSGRMWRMRATMAGSFSPAVGHGGSPMLMKSGSMSSGEWADWSDDSPEPANTKASSRKSSSRIEAALRQVPAIALIGIFHLMIGLPFGVSYFPISWSSQSGGPENATIEDGIELSGGPFPLPGKESLGIRMFLFSTFVGQIAFTLTSGFNNPIGLQMVENVPFCHELAAIVISHQGYGIDALSTLMVIFGLSSVFVGIIFLLLGHFKLGRIVYFFPNHVLVGFIGGIGVFIAKTGAEVAMNDSFNAANILHSKSHLILVVVFFEATLRVLEHMTKDADGKPKYTLLSPIYFCMITPMFYLGMLIFGFSVSHAEDEGYFFPPLDNDEDGAATGSFLSSLHLDRTFEMWDAIRLPSISFAAISDSLITMVSLSLFSLVHVPINIPAFALSTDTEIDMNNEMVAHGYSNIAAGLFGGLQNYMAYTQSLLYAKSGGKGKPSGFAVALVTLGLFVVGPRIAVIIPRCMAGTLLVHVGIDLFLEGVYDSMKSFDKLEYVGIWFIVLVMSWKGMDAAMVAGVISAVATYAVQSMAYLDPIRGSMSASTLRSSFSSNQMNRPVEAQQILDSPLVGRSRILVIQLQGHLFFGNMAQFIESLQSLLGPRNPANGSSRKSNRRKLKDMLSKRRKERKKNNMDVEANGGSTQSNDDTAQTKPIVVIFDFSLVNSIDSSAAQAIVKFKRTMLRKYDIQLIIFVSGSEEGFPTEYSLSQELSERAVDTFEIGQDKIVHATSDPDMPANEATSLLWQTLEGNGAFDAQSWFKGSHVRFSLDEALVLAENALIARENIGLLESENKYIMNLQNNSWNIEQSEEHDAAITFLSNITSLPSDDPMLEKLFSAFHRQEYAKDDVLWKQNSASDCAKLVLSGSLVAILEQEAGTTERIPVGSIIGELGLVENAPRMSSVVVQSKKAVLYNLSRESYERLLEEDPHVGRLVDRICIKYLHLRVQSVSNRIFETRCLPI